MVSLAEDWDEQTDTQLEGFVATEKYDGIRAVWTPTGTYHDGPGGPPGFMGKRGHRINMPPPALVSLLPAQCRVLIWPARSLCHPLHPSLCLCHPVIRRTALGGS